MRILLMANNWGGWRVTRWLADRGEQIVGLVVHPVDTSKWRDEIVSACYVPDGALFDADTLDSAKVQHRLRQLEPDIGVCAFFGYILKPAVFNIPRQGFVNLHTGYLPHNRGWHTNVYPFLNDSPAGVAIHWVDEGVDSGDVIARRRVEVKPHDTGGTLHQRLSRELIDLFKDTWPGIKDGTAGREPQERAPLHLRDDMRILEQIDLDAWYPARHLLGLLRGLTYPPYPAAYYEEGGQRVYVRVSLFGDEDLEEGALPEWE